MDWVWVGVKEEIRDCHQEESCQQLKRGKYGVLGLGAGGGDVHTQMH